MRFRFDHLDHRGGAERPGVDLVECRDLDEAERHSLKALCSDTFETASVHSAASITIRDERGKPLSIASIHSTVRRL